MRPLLPTLLVACTADSVAVDDWGEVDATWLFDGDGAVLSDTMWVRAPVRAKVLPDGPLLAPPHPGWDTYPTSSGPRPRYAEVPWSTRRRPRALIRHRRQVTTEVHRARSVTCIGGSGVVREARVPVGSAGPISG